MMDIKNHKEEIGLENNPQPLYSRRVPPGFWGRERSKNVLRELAVGGITPADVQDYVEKAVGTRPSLQAIGTQLRVLMHAETPPAKPTPLDGTIVLRKSALLEVIRGLVTQSNAMFANDQRNLGHLNGLIEDLQDLIHDGEVKPL